MGLLRSDIQNEINKAHVKIDELTWLMAKKYTRGHKYQKIAFDVFKAINFIKILELDENLTDKEVSWFIQALRELLSLHEVGYQPTTLEITLNQPALVVENSLVVSGIPSYIPKYDGLGTAFEDSTLSQAGGSLWHEGTQFFLGKSTTSSPTRLIEVNGTEDAIDLIIRASGDLIVQSNKLEVEGAAVFAQGLSFNTEVSFIDSFTDDALFTSPTSSQGVSATAIDTRINTEVSTLNSTIVSSVKTAGSGLHEISGSFYIGGNVIADAVLALQVGIDFNVTSPNTTAGISITADTSMSIFGPTGSITNTASSFVLGGSPLNYDIDRSGVYTARSVVDKGYVDIRIAGNQVTSLVSSPTATENDYSVVWDNSLLRYTLRLISTGAGGENDADTLDGLDSTQFLRSDIGATANGKLTMDLSASASSAGRQPFDIIISSDNSYASITMTRDGASNLDYLRFYNSDTAVSAKILVGVMQSDIADGTAPLIVASTTEVANLNAEQLGGYLPNISSDLVNTVVVRNNSGAVYAASLQGITSTTQVTNLNAQYLNGNTSSDFLRADLVNKLSYDLSFVDGKSVYLGDPYGLRIYHSGSSYLKMHDGSNLYVTNSSGVIIHKYTSLYSGMYYNGAMKLYSTSGGAYVSGTITASNFIDASDAKLKTKINVITNSDLTKLQYIEPIEYVLKKGNKQHQYGVLAQSLQNIFPELVYKQDDGYLSVDYRSLAMLTLAKVQQLEKRIKHLESI